MNKYFWKEAQVARFRAQEALFSGFDFTTKDPKFYTKKPKVSALSLCSLWLKNHTVPFALFSFHKRTDVSARPLIFNQFPDNDRDFLT